MPNAKSLEHKTGHQTEHIVRSITAAIADRRLKPGTKLTEQKLADIFSVSRTIVRQALNQLSRDHLVTLSPARGAFVASPTVKEARDVFAVRSMLEISLITALCPIITPSQVHGLRKHLKQEKAAIAKADISKRTRLLGHFHLLLATMLDNQVLTDLLTDLLNRSSLIALMYQSSPSAERSHEEHEQLVNALEMRDTKRAVELMRQHLEHLEYNLRIEPEPTDLADVLAHGFMAEPVSG